MEFSILQLSFWVLVAIYVCAALSTLFNKTYAIKLKVTVIGVDLLLAGICALLAIYSTTLVGTCGGVVFAILTAIAMDGSRTEGKTWKSIGYLILLAMLIVGLLGH